MCFCFSGPNKTIVWNNKPHWNFGCVGYIYTNPQQMAPNEGPDFEALLRQARILEQEPSTATVQQAVAPQGQDKLDLILKQLELSCWRISVTGWPFSIQQVVLHSQPWLLFDKRLELLTAIGTRRPGSIIHKTVNNTGDGRIICLFLMPVNHPANRGGLKQIRNNSIIKCTRLNSTRIGGNILAHGMDHRRRNLLEILWPRDSWEGISITIGRSWTIDDVKVVLRQICNPSMASGI